MTETLTVTGMTCNSGARLPAWIARAREYADEVVLLVDDSSSDDTYDIARAHADRVQLVQHPPFIEVFYDLALRQATGDWILWLDDDEVIGDGFAEAKSSLLTARDLTHYYLPYRWVVRDAAGDRWLSTFPWHPNPRLRLIRNIGSLWSHRGRLHSPLDIAGEGRVLDPDEGVIYHLDLAWRSRADREAKVARYRGNNAPSCEEYYLYEDYALTLKSEPLDEQMERAPTPAGQAAADLRLEKGPVDVSDVVAQVTAEQSRIAQFWDNAPVFGAEYVSSTTPTNVLANRGYTVDVVVRNTSQSPWRNSGLERGRITLSYHWLAHDHGVLLREGDRSLLNHVVAPGETTTIAAGVWTPYEPGEYTLQWDLLSEQVNWFSDRGVEPLSTTVTVSADDRLLTCPRTVALLPSTQEVQQSPELSTLPAGQFPARLTRFLKTADRRRRERRRAVGRRRSDASLSGRNLTVLRAARALDTRDGTGVPGAVNGPVEAGSVVSLQLGGRLGIPDFASGIVATLAVPNASYNGFVEVYAGVDAPPGTVSGYFRDTEPASFQVLSALENGRLSIWLSDNWPGTAQLLLDVTGYLTG